MDKSIDISGLNLHYTDNGSGQPIVLLHGWGCSGQTLASVAAVAEPFGRVINIDLPGFGQSDEPIDVWGVQQYARLLELWLDAVNAKNPILIGHSFGGRVALTFASRLATRALILVDSAGVKPKRTIKHYYKVYSFKAMRKVLELFLGHKKAQPVIERIRAHRASADYMAASPMMRKILSRVVNEDLCPLMPRIKCPTLLIWGANDTATPVSDAHTMERLIPEAGLVVFEDAGHYSFLDEPARFAAVLRSFLQSLIK